MSYFLLSSGCQINGAPDDALSFSSTKCLKVQGTNPMFLTEESHGKAMKLCGEQQGQLLQFKDLTEFAKFKLMLMDNANLGIMSSGIWIGAGDLLKEGVIRWQDGKVFIDVKLDALILINPGFIYCLFQKYDRQKLKEMQ